jgi:predicted permease
MAILLLGGVLRSVFFTGSNAIGYADVDDDEASQATAIVAVCQQLSVAFGVAVAGGILEMSTRLRGSELALLDFQIAFFVVGGLSTMASFIYWRLPPDAGSNVSGHKRAAIEKE